MSHRPGFALLYTIFVIMALVVVGLALMAVGTREAMIAGAVERRAIASVRADAAALDAVAAWSTREWSELEVGAGVRDPSAPAGTRRQVSRLDTTLYLVAVEAAHPAPARAALLIRTLDPSAMAAAFPSAITAGEYVEVRAGTVGLVQECAGHAPTILAPEVVVRPDAVVSGNPAIALGVAPPPPSPDPFSLPLITTLATSLPLPGTVTPAPIVGIDGCVPAERNWGAVDPGHPCHHQIPVVHVGGSIRMSGGEGRGILVVDGDAHLSDGARFHGLVLVRERLLLTDDSRVRGAIRAASVTVRHGIVQGDPCVLSDVLSAPSLDRAFRAPGRWWVPLF